MEFRIAKQQETDKCWEIIKEARACLKSLGVNQWQQEYPGREDVAKDINEGNGYVLVTENAVMAYACISFGGEPSYDSIRGAWKSVQPTALYIVWLWTIRVRAEDSHQSSSGLPRSCACPEGYTVSKLIRTGAMKS